MISNNYFKTNWNRFLVQNVATRKYRTHLKGSMWAHDKSHKDVHGKQTWLNHYGVKQIFVNVSRGWAIRYHVFNFLMDTSFTSFQIMWVRVCYNIRSEWLCLQLIDGYRYKHVTFSKRSMFYGIWACSANSFRL